MVRWDGQRRGVRAADAYRQAVGAALEETLEAHVGRPFKDVLRSRALLIASLAQVQIEAQQARRRLARKM